MHNGFIAGFHVLRRDLMLAIDPELFAEVQGSTDSEVVFHLALTLGLEEDPIAGARAHGRPDRGGGGRARHRRRGPGEFGVSDGDDAMGRAVRDRGRARSLFASADIDAIRHLYPDNQRLQRAGATTA